MDKAEELLRKEITKLKGIITKHKSIESIITSAIFDVMGKKNTIVTPKLPKVDSRNIESEIAVLHYSDSQIGKETKSYNTKIARERLMQLVNKTVQITNMRRNSAKIEEIHMYLGGDTVEGEEIFAHQAHEIDSSVFEQSVKAGADMITEAILVLLENFKKVKVVGVPGNHGRNGKYGGNGHPETNWDTVCYSVVRRNLLGSPVFPRTELAGRLEFPDTYDWFYVDKVYDWGNLVVHGDQIMGGGGGFPIASISRRAMGWIDSIDDNWDNLFLGHFHTYASFVLNHRMVLANGTTESDNDYAKRSLSATGWPCQRLCFFNEKHGLISDNQIYLGDKDAHLPTKRRVTRKS